MSESHGFEIADYCAWQELGYTWARSVDTKEWSCLRTIFTPKIMFDYTKVYGFKEESMAIDDYIALVSGSLGDPDIASQHLLASCKVRSISPTTATVEFQLRAAHMRIEQNPRKEVAMGHAHGILQFYYQKFDDGWKISGMRAVGDFVEGDILAVFPTWPGKGNDVKWAY